MLHIRRLELNNLATHNQTSLDLPERGLVSIIGGNGVGKSTLLEAVATGLWGESLRGETCWRSGEGGSVHLTTDQMIVTRKRNKAGASKVEWQHKQFAPTTYETSSKAQAALEVLIGSFDVWRRTCVLSSLDSAAFSLARDSDRKRLLEEFLGLEMFDAALEACRKDRKEAEAAVQKAEAHRSSVELRLQFAASSLATAQKAQADLMAETDNKDSAVLKAEEMRLAALVKAASDDLQKAVAEQEAIKSTVQHEESLFYSEKARIKKLASDECPTCGQDVANVRSKLQEEADRFTAQKEKHIAKLNADYEIARNAHSDLLAEYNALYKKHQTVLADLRLSVSLTKQRAQVEQQIAKAEADFAKWTEMSTALEKDGGKAALDVAHLATVEQVLGLRGVRSQVLDHALSALEQQANAWLSRMPTDQGTLTITLSGSTTQKSGSVVDAISLKVRGRPYAACSGGERRRVDVAILLALRELSVAAHGRDGTLFCDEVFDALDQQGQLDVADALREMAADRLVVVITHSPDLVTALRPDRTLQVSLRDGHAHVETA